MAFSFNLSLLLFAWFVLFVLQLAIAPVMAKYLSHLADRGWAFGRLVGWLIVGLFVWYFGHLQVPLNQQLGIWGVFLALIGVAGLINFIHRREINSWLKGAWPIILLEEIIFLSGFVGFGMVRSFNPEILGLEKFMDAGLIASYLRSPVLPIEDMWLAGEKVNYYSFGHFLGAIMTRIWAVDLVYAYNLLLALIFALSLTGSFSVIFNLANLGHKIPRLRTAGGAFIGAVALVLGGNSHVIWKFLDERSLEGYWYAEATRFIEFTIHEFPAYSFIVSDLHAHVWGLPIVLLFLNLCLAWYLQKINKEPGIGLVVSLGILLGVLAMTNTWDLMIYGLFLGGVFTALVLSGASTKQLFFDGLAAALAMIATSGFWFINFQSISAGIALVEVRSPLSQLIILWGGHLVLGLLAILLATEMKRATRGWQIRFSQPLVPVLVGVALLFLLLPELIYFKDIYPSHPRANTMFKFTYQSFILLTLAGGWLLSKWSSDSYRIRTRLALAGVSLGIIAGLLLFPYPGYDSYYRGFNQMEYLDGSLWLQAQFPDDYQAIVWLKQNTTGRPVVLEAVGESYTTFARVSANTGLPTVLGWRVHEWLWRNSFDEPSRRTVQVKAIYEQPLSAASIQALAEHRVRYIIVGSKERENYRLDEGGLESLGEVVFRSGQTSIIKL
jgi:uncharacterized membrane protein